MLKLVVTTAGLAIFLAGCPTKGDDVIIDAPVISVPKTPQEQEKLTFNITKDGNKHIITPARIPENTTRLRCAIDNIDYGKCHKTLEISPLLAEGKHTLVANYMIQNFSRQDTLIFYTDGSGKVISQSSPSDNGVPIISLRPSKSFANFAPVTKNKALVIPLAADSSTSCNLEIFCSYDNTNWAKCLRSKNSFDIQINARAVLSGFQSLQLKGRCEDSLDKDEFSNILDISFFGVSPNYKPLKVLVTRLGRFYDISLERSHDCMGTLQYQRKTSDNQWANTSNIAEIKLDGHTSIFRAQCTPEDGEAKIGPPVTL